MEEIWKFIDLEGFPPYRYQVSNLGRVRNYETKVLKLQSSRDKNEVNTYKLVSFRSRPCGLHITRYVHRLVALAFLPIVEGKDMVNHKDGNKSNNNVDNLEWVSHQENVDHSWGLGLSSNYSETHGNAKLSDQQAYDVKYSVGSCKDVALLYNISATTVCLIRNGKRYCEGINKIESEVILY